MYLKKRQKPKNKTIASKNGKKNLVDCMSGKKCHGNGAYSICCIRIQKQ